jgi:hypothetical protein
MKKIWLLFIVALGEFPVAHAGVTLKEIRAASNDVLVAFFTGDSIDVNEIDIGNEPQWKINGKPAAEI